LALLILVMCLTTDPSQCQEVKPALERTSLQECYLQAQVWASQWVDEHPKWRFVKSRCEIGGQSGDHHIG
jgi:hypothetical protein